MSALSAYTVAALVTLPSAWLYAKAAYGTLHFASVGVATAAAIAWAAAEYVVRVPTNRWVVSSLQLSSVEMQVVWIATTLLTSYLVGRG